MRWWINLGSADNTQQQRDAIMRQIRQTINTTLTNYPRDRQQKDVRLSLPKQFFIADVIICSRPLPQVLSKLAHLWQKA